MQTKEDALEDLRGTQELVGVAARTIERVLSSGLITHPQDIKNLKAVGEDIYYVSEFLFSLYERLKTDDII